MADIQQLTYPFFMDGTTPLNASNLNQLVSKINELVVKANSGVTPTQTVATPTISISGSTATIACSTSGATIRYAIDGTPTESSGTIITSGGTVNLSSYNTQKTIRAIAYKSGMTTSQVAQATYTPSSQYQYYAASLSEGKYKYATENVTGNAVLVDSSNSVVVTLQGASGYVEISSAQAAQIAKVGLNGGQLTLTPMTDTVYEATSQSSYTQFHDIHLDAVTYHFTLSADAGANANFRDANEQIILSISIGGDSDRTVTQEMSESITYLSMFKGVLIMSKYGTPQVYGNS